MSARKSERLLNLLITLLVARTYVSKQRLREIIPDYREAPSEDAFERMFDRDKEDLRALGVPVETGSHDPLFDDDPGYRIPRSAFELPDIALEPDEAAVVGLAARVWQQAGLASATTDALRKLRAAGVAVDREALDVLQPQAGGEEPAFEAFWEAVAARRPVRFPYRASGAPEPAVRRLEPWGVVSYRGRWYVVGHDRDRGERRLFRLSRVTGAVAADGPDGSVEVPEGTDVRAVTTLLAPDTPDRTAVVRARAGKAVGLRHRATATATGDAGPGWDRLELRFGRTAPLVDELASYGPDVVVESPQDVRDAVVRRLEEAAGLAAGSGSSR